VALDDQQRLEEIRNARLHRLRLLEKRQAVEGFRVDPAVIAEIAQTRAELGMVDSALSHPVNAETAEAMGAGGRYLATDRKLDLLFKMLTERMDRMEEHADDRYQTQERKHEAGARLYQFLFVLLSIGLIISLVIGAFLIGGAFR
jgi:hypothetical protein